MYRKHPNRTYRRNLKTLPSNQALVCVHELHLMSKFYKIQFKKINEWAMVSFRTVCDIFTFPSSRHLSFSFSPVKKDIVSFVSREFSWFLGCRLLPRTERLMFHLKLSRIRDGTVCSSSKSKLIQFLADM